MSGTVDNIMLALVSFKKELVDFLNDEGWENHVVVALAKDPNFVDKEIVEQNPVRNQVALPIVAVDTGRTFGGKEELGDTDGYDYVSLAIYVMARDHVQLVTLANLIRRKVDDFAFDIKNYTSNYAESLGTGTLYDSEFIDLSIPGADAVHERYTGIINCTLELNATDMI